MNKEPEKIIVDLIQTELSLPDDYGQYQGNVIPSISIGSQNTLLGNTDKLQVIVQSISDKVIHNDNEYKETNDGYTEVSHQIIFSTIQVDIQSRNNDARTRRHELLSALSSTYCQSLQEKYGCRIFDVPVSFINTSNVQGGSALNRWTLRFKMTYRAEHTKVIDYYDKFSTEINTETTKDTIYFNYDE